MLLAGLVSAALGLLQYYGLAGPLGPLTISPDSGQAYGNLRQRNRVATLIRMRSSLRFGCTRQANVACVRHAGQLHCC